MQSFKKLIESFLLEDKGTQDPHKNYYSDEDFSGNEYKDIQTPNKGLFKHENSLSIYRSTHGSKNINHFLRHGESYDDDWNDYHGDKPIEHHISNLDALVHQNTLNHDTHVWRGIDQKAKNALKLGKNTIIKDKGYVSTSLNPGMAMHVSRNWGTAVDQKKFHVMHIKVPKGSKGVHAPSHSELSSMRENEVILPRNSKFRYEGSSQHTRTIAGKDENFTIHHLTHIPEDSK